MEFMFRKYLLILNLFALSCFQGQLNAQHSSPLVVVDTLNFCISIDSSTISLYENVEDRTFWLDILSRDTTLISHLKKQYRLDNAEISILSIKEITDKNPGYKFTVYCRPRKAVAEFRGDSLPIPMIPRQAAYYRVKLTDAADTVTRKIIKVDYLWSEL